MGRSLGLEPCLGGKLAAIAGRGAGSGVLVGTLVDDSYHVIFVAETPSEEEEQQEEEGGEKERPAPQQRELDVSWLAEHAKQVLRLLPGGLTVLGFFLARPDSFLTSNDGKLRKLLRATSALEDGGELVVLQSAIVGKVLDSKTSSFKAIEVKTATKAVQFSRVESQLVLDIPVALPRASDALGEDVKPALKKFLCLLANTVFVFDNKVLGDDALLGAPLEVEKRKGKGKGAKVEVVDEEDDSEEQKVIHVELLATETVVEDVVVEEDTAARMKLAGKLSCRAYIPPGARVQWARAAIVTDLTRSLVTRLAMHTESLSQEDEQQQQQQKIVHEPPRRVFVTVPDSSVTVCDYLYPGEGAEDCVNNVREIFGWQLQEDSIEDDLEIVASPREARPQGPGGDTGVGTRQRRAVPGLGYALALGVGAVCTGLAWMSMGRAEEGGAEGEL